MSPTAYVPFRSVHNFSISGKNLSICCSDLFLNWVRIFISTLMWFSNFGDIFSMYISKSYQILWVRPGFFESVRDFFRSIFLGNFFCNRAIPRIGNDFSLWLEFFCFLCQVPSLTWFFWCRDEFFGIYFRYLFLLLWFQPIQVSITII